ncbi:hypothetical protein TcWFU_005007 [Taenia crassiceps]|uniref:Uncharacterized protein n=1 Tax=Taenia crassiceps TaxID=6207 RepID=A0ABR4QQJ0_9CEST
MLRPGRQCVCPISGFATSQHGRHSAPLIGPFDQIFHLFGSHRCNAPSNANTGCNPSNKTGDLNAIGECVLSRLSTQVELEHLRSTMHEIERVRLFCINSGCSSNSVDLVESVEFLRNRQESML